MRTSNRILEIVSDMNERLVTIEHQAELMKTVLIVKEPGTVDAANAYDGLRKQIAAAAGERRSHLTQLATMAVAISRAASLEDLRLQVKDWMSQAGVVEIDELPPGSRAHDVFEDLEGGSLAESALLDIVEPAYLDSQTGMLLRLGRARPRREELIVDSSGADGAVPLEEQDSTLAPLVPGPAESGGTEVAASHEETA